MPATVRLRIPELLAERGFGSATEFARSIAGPISERQAYNLVRRRGEVEAISARVLLALAGFFDCDVPDLFVRSSGNDGNDESDGGQDDGALEHHDEQHEDEHRGRTTTHRRRRAIAARR